MICKDSGVPQSHPFERHIIVTATYAEAVEGISALVALVEGVVKAWKQNPYASESKYDVLIQENVFQNVACKISAKGQCVEDFLSLERNNFETWQDHI